MGCHFLLQCMKVKSESEVAQSCPTLSDPMDCSPPGSSIHGIFQARVVEWVAIAFSPGWTRKYNPRSGKEARRIPSLRTHTHTEDLPPGAHHPSLGKTPRLSDWGSQSREKSSKIRVRPHTQEAAGRTDLSGRSVRSTDAGQKSLESA